MIDTIKFKIEITPRLYESIKRKSIELTKRDNEIDKEFVKILTKNFRVGSFDRHINLKLFDENVVFMEFSLPKIYYGHNVYMIAPEQCLEICEQVQIVLKQMFGEFPDVIFWQITRVDFCYAWKLPSEYVAEQVLNIIKNVHVARKSQHFYNTTVMFAGRTQSVKFYLKYPEFYEHDFKELRKEGKNDLAYQFLNISEGVLRFEVTLRNIALVREFYGRCSDKNIALSSDIFNTKRITQVLRKFIHKVLKLNNLSTTNNKRVYETLCNYYNKRQGRQYFLFYKLLFAEDTNEQAILKSYSRSQYYYMLGKLQKAGIGISIKQSLYSFDFSIPSDYAINFPRPTR